MRKAERTGGYILCLALNLLLNADGLIPAAILLVLHFLLHISVWWAFAAAGVWLLYTALWTAFIGYASGCSNERDIPKENKNPYSERNLYK